MIFEHIFHEIAVFATLPATGKVIFAGGNPFFYDFFYGEKSKYDITPKQSKCQKMIKNDQILRL